MRSDLLEMFGVSLALTAAVEWIVVRACSFMDAKESQHDSLRGRICRDTKESQRGSWPAIHGRNGILLIILVNVLTNPAAVLLCWLGRMYLPGTANRPVQLVVEIAVIAVEAWVYCSFSGKARWGIRRPVMLSVIANLCSWMTGVIVQASV